MLFKTLHNFRIHRYIELKNVILVLSLSLFKIVLITNKFKNNNSCG